MSIVFQSIFFLFKSKKYTYIILVVFTLLFFVSFVAYTKHIIIYVFVYSIIYNVHTNYVCVIFARSYIELVFLVYFEKTSNINDRLIISRTYNDLNETQLTF